MPAVRKDGRLSQVQTIAVRQSFDLRGGEERMSVGVGWMMGGDVVRTQSVLPNM